MIFDVCCAFSRDFQGPQRTGNDQFSELLTSWNMPFFGQRFGPQHVDIWDHFGEPFAPQKTDQNDVRKVMKNEAPKKADLGRVVKHIFS